MKLRRLLSILGRKFPKQLAESYDHVGLQSKSVDMDKDIQKVFLCLDFSEDCLKECLSFSPDIIISHHPFYFGKRREIILFDPKKAEIEKQIDSLSAPIYSFHTNYDKAKGGMNDTLLKMLGYDSFEVGKDGILRIINLAEPISTKDFAKKLLDRFSFSYCGMIDDSSLNGRVGIIAGGAGNDIFEVMKENVDLFVSGDMSHHSRLDCRRYHLNYIEFPHEVEEEVFLHGFKDTLLSIDKSLEILPFSYEKYFTPVTGKHFSLEKEEKA